MIAISRWLPALALAASSAIVTAPVQAATLTPLTIDCDTAPSSSAWNFITANQFWNNNTTVQVGDVITLTFTDCSNTQLSFGPSNQSDPAAVGITFTSSGVSYANKTISSNPVTATLTFAQALSSPYGLLVNSTVDYEIFFIASRGGGGGNQRNVASTTFPMLAEADPVLTRTSSAVSCQLPSYQYYGKPEWAAYTLKVDGVSVSTTRTDATTMPLWVINDVAEKIDEKATLEAGVWAWNSAWQGKKLQCFVTAYGHHALGNTFSNVLG